MRWIFIMFWVGLFSIEAQTPQEEYILEYKDVAISEMGRTGIPASIKLAQAILESNWGKSYLATTANNHFGIKCGNNWTGQKAHRKDDDYKNGKLVKSCFRKYANAKESFMAHSDFLTDPRKSHRYGRLFTYEPTDYKRWAKGLKEAGYATNPKYPQLLIDLIETHQLYAYDQVDQPLVKAPDFLLQEGYQPQVEKNNGVAFVYAREGETPEKIAMDFKVGVEDIIHYNENLSHKNQALIAGNRVYLEKKKSSFKGKKKYHKVTQNERMIDIAQAYGIRLEKLLKKNKMEPGQEPAMYQKVRLRGIHWFDDKPQLRKVKTPIEHAPLTPEEKGKEEIIVPTSPSREADIKAEVSTRSTYPQVSLPDERHKKRYYTVKEGDTLYAISQKYSISVPRLMVLNKLMDSTISIGQNLRIR